MTMLITMERMTAAIPATEWWRAVIVWINKVLAMASGKPGMSDKEANIISSDDVSSTISLDPEQMQRFKQTMLPLLDSAYSLARYLLRDKEDAEDVVQEVYLRALKAFPEYRGGDAKSWLLAIVRNCCMTWIAKNARDQERVVNADEDLNMIHSVVGEVHATPEREYDAQQRARLIRELIEALSEPLREVLILREIEELSYAQIASIMQIPVGTVMSRLARARTQLSAACQQQGLVMS
ncbi:MAG: sigma-70 family RNA polymerase sigma factor [Steroidobacter sp.]